MQGEWISGKLWVIGAKKVYSIYKEMNRQCVADVFVKARKLEPAARELKEVGLVCRLF